MANVNVGLGHDKHQPEMVETGANIAVCRISLSATTSVGDVLRLGKLPNGAVPTDAVFYPGPAYAAGIWKFGWSASQAAFIASATLSVVTRGNVALTNPISLSDDAGVMFEYIVGVPSAAVTVGYHGNLVVTYKMPGQTP